MSDGPAPMLTNPETAGAALDRPVLVTGTPRSGKSLVAHMLAASGEFAVVKEPLSIWSIGGASGKDDRRTADEATEAVKRSIQEACAAELARVGKSRYVDDLAYHALRLPFALRVAPDARVIHVVRDPEHAIPEMMYGWAHKDTVAAAVKRRRKGLRLRAMPRLLLRFGHNYVASRLSGRRATWGPVPPGFRDFAPGRSVAEVAAYQWAQLVRVAREGMAQLPPEQCLELRHEDIVRDPAATAKRVAAFCEAQHPDTMIRYAVDVIRPDYRFEKRIEPTEDEWRRIREILARFAPDRSSETITTTREPSPRETIHD